MKKDDFMYLAFLEAKKAMAVDEVPVGCVIVCENDVIACGYNEKESKNNVFRHAEIVAIEKACGKLKTWHLNNCDLYVTLEPCMMCMGAIIESRIKNVYFGTKYIGEQMFDKNKIDSFVHLHFVENSDCSKILTDFFENKRKK